MWPRVGLVFSAILFCAITARTAIDYLPDATIRPLVSYAPGMQSVPVELPGVVYYSPRGSLEVHRVRLTLPDVTAIPAHSGLRLLVATYDTTPVLQSAELRLVGTRCRFVTAPGATFPNNDTLMFERVSACAPLQGLPTGEADLIIRFSGPGRAALWTWVPPAGTPPTGAIIVNDPERFESPAHPAVRGDYIDAFANSKSTRLHLLTYMWEFRGAREVLVLVLVASSVFILASAVIWPLTRSAPRVTGIAAGSLMAGLGILYAAFIPPFQAPDEPSHFLGILYSLDGQRHDSDVQRWAQRTHFESLRFDGAERFRPSDVGRPETQEWLAVPPTWFSTRTNLLFIWRAAGRGFDGWSFPALFLALRITHALLLAIGVAVATWAVSAWVGSPDGWRALTPLWAVPSIPFFGMHVSNYALILPAYVLIAAAGAILFKRGRNAHKAGALLGAGLAIAASGSRSALPLLPLVACMVALRFVAPAGARSEVLTFWGGLSIGLIGLAATPGTLASTDLPLGPMRALPVVTAALLGVLCLWDVRRRSTAAGMMTRGASAAAVALAAAILMLLLGSLLVYYPVLERVNLASPPPVSRYLASAASSALTWPRLRNHDFLLSTSFWGAFGWLDRVLPEWAITVFVATSSVAASALLISAGRRRDAPMMRCIATIAAGAAVSFVAYAVVTLKASPDLHGRYLLGLYLCVLVTISTVSVTSSGESTRPWQNVLHVGLPIVAHGLTFAFVMSRYF